MSTSGNAHRGHGHGPSAVMEPPDLSVRETPPQTQTRPTIKRPSNQVMVLLIALAIFTALISLPWILDTLQDDKTARNSDSAKTASLSSSPASSPFPGSAPGIDSRFGTPRSTPLSYPHQYPQQAPMASHTLQPPYQPIPMPMRPFAMPNNGPGAQETARRPTPVQEFVPMGRSLAAISQHSEGDNHEQAAQHPGTLAIEAAEPSQTPQTPHYSRSQEQAFSAPFESEGKRLPSSIQAPAEAMARLLSGQDVPMESYYAAIYGNGAVSPESGLVDHPAMSPSSTPPIAVQHNPQHGGKSPRQPGGVYERHQMFVMR